jgi:hypothetical protein
VRVWVLQILGFVDKDEKLMCGVRAHLLDFCFHFGIIGVQDVILKKPTGMVSLLFKR